MARAIRTLACVALGLAYLLQVTGCSTWVSQRDAPEVAVVTHPGRDVRVTRADGSRLELVDARVVGDSLYGRPAAKPRDPGPRPYESATARDTTRPAELALPLADVTRMELRLPHAGRSVAAAVGVVAVVALVVGAGIAASNFNPMGGCCGVRMAP